MMLSKLCELYDRLANDPDHGGDIARPGWSVDKVAWVLVIDETGAVKGLHSLAVDEKRRFQEHLIPEHAGRSGKFPEPYFLCDKASYLLGLDEKGDSANRERSRAKHEEVLEGCEDAAACAVRAFFDNPDPAASIDEEKLAELAPSDMITFCYERGGEDYFIHKRPAIRAAWDSYCAKKAAEDQVMGRCSVTGEHAPLARLFPQVSGVPGAQSAGASLVSFNFDAVESYGKKQAYNASLSSEVAFKAGSALKYLLGNKDRRTMIGGIVVTYWTDAPTSIGDAFLAYMFGERVAAEDKGTRDSLDVAFDEMKRGVPLTGINAEVGYCILGVSPNAARLAVCFFESGTLGQLAERYGQYLRDIDMVKVGSPTVRQLLLQTAPMGKDDNVPKTLFAQCMAAVLGGGDFPLALEQLVRSRMRADHASNNVWDLRQRAAILKASLIRRQRRAGIVPTDKERIDVVLNRENTNIGYLLGRLFAVLERAQEGAVAGANATVRDRYIAAASTTPARVFQPLMRGCQMHLAALRKDSDKSWLAAMLEKELNEIFGRGFPGGAPPRVLDVDDQNQFYVAYYQERVFLWMSKGERAAAEAEAQSNEDKED